MRKLANSGLSVKQLLETCAPEDYGALMEILVARGDVTPEDVFRELTLPGGRQAYGAVSTLELEYELARGASLSRSRSRS